MGRLLHFLSLLCCAFVIVSFFLFAVAQTSHAAKGQANAISNGAAGGTAAKSTAISKEHQPRRFIDQVAQKLNSPFTGIVSTKNIWIEHLIPTAISLLLYGFGLSLLARWAAGRPS
jgi:hypothetical protein